MLRVRVGGLRVVGGGGGERGEVQEYLFLAPWWAECSWA